MIIDKSKTLSFEEGFSSYDIDLKDELDLDFVCDCNCNILFRIINATKINIRASFINGSKCSILFWNDSKCDIETDEKYEIKDDCDINISYGECNGYNTTRKVDADLIGTNCNMTVNTASLVNTNKKYDISVINDNINTHGKINNYAVTLNNGKLEIDAVGKINKGSKKSTSHQISRSLSFEEGSSATILPELLIDENDVQASHAMSIGRVDEKQLYYMMSRGLDIKECTMLISLGYLLPIVDNLTDEDLKDAMKNELERKIVEVCSM